MAAKPQAQIPGTERPSIPKLDASCLKVMKLEEKLSKLKDQLKAAKAENREDMKEARDQSQLEEDTDQNHVYVFELGAKLKTCVVKREDTVMFRDTKKPKLEVVELEE